MFSCVLFGVFLFCFYFLLKQRKKDHRLPPGVYGWSFIGKLPSMKTPIFDQVETFRKQLGDTFIWKIGSKEVLILCDPVLIRKAFGNPLIVNRPEEYLTFDSWSFFKKIGIANSNDDTWQVHRRFSLRHLRDSGFGTSSIPEMIRMETESLIQDLQENYLNKPVQTPLPINIATVNIIWQIVADIRLTRTDKELHAMMKSLTDIFKFLQGLVNIYDFFPWLFRLSPNFVLRKTGFLELQKIRAELFLYLKTIVDQRKKVLDKSNPVGLIDFYLLEIENSRPFFSEDSLLVTLGDLFFAGSETTATHIHWTLYYMARHQDVQKRIQKEIDAAVPREKLPDLSDKPNLPYTEATTFEILRAVTLVPFSLFHATSQDTMVDSFFIPKGTVVCPYIYGCHNDPKYWKKPTEFYPEHFIDADGKFSGNNDAFMPFSVGRRMCLGESLARLELFLFVSALLQKFTIDVPAGETLSLDRDPKYLLFGTPPAGNILIRNRE